MSTELGSKFVTLADWAKRQDPGGGVADVIEVLAESNPIMQDASIMEGNLPTGHRSTQRVTQPSGTWRRLNQGVAETKSTTRQVDDQCGMLEAYSAIDVALANLSASAQAFRASEDNAFVMGLSEDAVDAIIYGNSGVDPEKPHGLAPRYNSLTAGTYEYMVNCSGSGSDNTSMWLVTWGEKTCSFIYPKGSTAGMKSQDLGERPWDDASGNPYQAFVTHFQWHLGLSLLDYRYVIRMCNIDVPSLTTDASSGADLMAKMVTAYYKRPSSAIGQMTRAYWYCNKTVAEYLHHQASNKSNVNLTIDTAGGQPIVSFLGAPIHVCDAITSAEATIS